MMLTQVSVFLENKEGRLEEVLKLLAEAHVNIRALTIAETSDYGVLRLIVDSTGAALEVLKQNHFRVNETNVMVVEVKDEVGAVYQMLNLLSKEKINIEYAYSCISPNPGTALFVLRVNDNIRENAVKVLQSCPTVMLLGS